MFLVMAGRESSNSGGCRHLRTQITWQRCVERNDFDIDGNQRKETGDRHIRTDLTSNSVQN